MITISTRGAPAYRGLAAKALRGKKTGRCVVLLCALFSPCGLEAWADDRSLTAAIDEVVSAAAQSMQGAALVVSVRARGREVYAGSRGYSDIAHRIVAGPETAFGIGSLTKSLTAQTVLSLVADGQLKLDDTVRSLLPAYRGPGRVATVRQLLGHTSGIANYTDSFALRAEGLGYTQTQILSLFAEAPLLFDPGDEWLYSNSGYYLLGLIVEEVTKLPYAEALRRQVLDPLNLDRTNLYSRERIDSNMASGYEAGPDGKLVNAPPLDAAVAFSAGAVRSTASDVSRFIELICNPSFAAGRVGRMTFEHAKLNDGTPTDYDLGGLWDRPLDGHRRIYHVGLYPGFEAHMACLPDSQASIVILQNVSGLPRNPAALGVRIARLILGVKSAADPPAANLTPEIAARLSGRFWFADRSQPLREMRLFWSHGVMKAEKRTYATRTVVNALYVGRQQFVMGDDPDTTISVDVSKHTVTLVAADYSLIGKAQGL